VFDLKLETTKRWEKLTEKEREFWKQRKCKTCFFFRARVQDGETYCSIPKKKAHKSKIGRYSITVKPDDEPCKRYKNDIIGRERLLRKKK